MTYPLHPVAALMPSMRDEEYAALRDDIRAHGQREPITLWRGQVIDGRHRLRVCEELGIAPLTREWDGDGSMVAYVLSVNVHRRHLGPSQRAIIATDALPLFEQEAKERMALGGKGVAQMPPLEPRKARDDAAAAVSVSPRYVQDAKAIKQRAPDLAEEVRSGARTITEAKRIIKEQDREARREENRARVRETNTPIVTAGQGRFATILIDPPWDFREEGDDDVYGRTRPAYAQMSDDAIAALPVGELADIDCHLYLWITNRSLLTGKGWRLCDAWGFRPITILTWCKPSIGVGNYFRNNTEHLVFAVKGSQAIQRRNVGTWFEAPRGPDGHSSKPNESYGLIESCSPGPYLEMFSRRGRHGWSVWGAEANERSA